MSQDIIAQSRDRKRRYDRQLRLWGEHGQDALENAKIALLYATATGTETAKNLVLPGAGVLTVIDPYYVTRADLGKNFFVDGDSVGKPRAHVCAELLNELNELVKVNHAIEDPVKLIENNINYFKAFTQVILAQDIPTSSLLKLDAFCSQNRITLFVVRAYGFMGYLRIATSEHRIYESKPDNFRHDLRVLNPWPELARFVDEFPMTPDMDQHLYQHIPWLVLVMRQLKAWRDTHGGAVPANRAEQDEFRAKLRALHRTHDEENIAQAVENAHFAWSPMKINSDLQKIYDDAKTNVDATSRPFWIMARAVKDFIANEGQGMPPLSGVLPDMVADTKSFVQLQQLFKDKAEADFQAVRRRVHALLASIGRPTDSIKDDYIRLACKNAWFWKLLRYRSITQEHTTPNKSALGAALSFMKEMDKGCAPLYVMLRAADKFRDATGHLPDAPGETPQLEHFAAEVCKQFDVDPADAEIGKYAQEFVRWGGAELHNIAAFMGGVTAQEVIKIVTEQLVPVNNTFVFNGMQSATAVYEL